jgi:hypothetical protein
MAGLVQVKRKTSLTITETFEVDGSPVNVDSGLPTLVATFPDGTALSPLPTVSGSWTGRTTGQYRVVLPAQPEVTWIDYELTGPIGGLPQTVGGRVEWLGELLFNLAELRAMRVAGSKPFNATDYPDSVVLARRAEVTDDFEARCGWSFIPRFAREITDGTGRAEILLDHLKASKLLSVTVNGVAQTVGNYTLDRSGVLRATSAYMASGWFQGGVSNVTVEYQHGWDRPPAAISSAALARTAMLLAPSQAGSTVSSWTTPDGTTYSMDAAGQVTAAGTIRHYGVPGIDSVLNSPAYNAMGMAVA